ncbi:MAG: serine hydrolase [Rhodospirillaceae bacterium]|nr:serine hydrolase [Rhodospirillaceae bacterium]MBT5779263.1 serine hydrolase [Rhodospirillaceae bacterium]
MAALRAFAVLLLILFAALPGAAFAACPSGPAPKALAGFDEFAREILADWHVPGLALGVVQDGETLYCAGYGLGDVEDGIAATPETIFAIGSITKSFTVAGLAMLVDEGRLDWDKPVRKILPAFTLADPVATAHTTARDMVTHRTGMARHDMLWYGSGLDSDQLFTGLRHLAPGAPFRSDWQYNNLMFAATGRITAALSGESWQEFTQRRLLTPLGMARTDFAAAEGEPNRAKPYEIGAGQIHRVPFYNMAAIAPAGAINSTVADMTSYLAFHMQRGRHAGTQLLSAAQAKAMQTPRVALDETPIYDTLGAPSYGMGFLISTYRGHKIIWHAGGIDGFVALLAFLPDAGTGGIGVVALSNLDRNPAPTLLTRNLFDRLLGLKPLPWNDWVASDYLEWEFGKRQEAAQHARSRDLSAPPTHALVDFAGAYHHPAYGEIRISYAADGLVLEYGQFTLPLRHYRGDIFEIVKIPVTSRSHLEVTFSTNESGEIKNLAVPFERAVADILFARAD